MPFPRTFPSDTSADFGAVTATGLDVTVATVAATGADAAGAAVLSSTYNAVTGADGAKGVALPAAAASDAIHIINTSLTANLLVYPVSGGNDNINGLAEDLAFTMGPGKSGTFLAVSATQWYVSDAAGVTATTTEANYVDVTTVGVAQASKAVVLGASKEIATLGDVALTSLQGGPLAGFRNAVINGAMMVAQRGTSFESTTTPANNDDTYLLDRWTLLSDGNDAVDVTQNTATVPTGGLNTIALDVETANKKFGIIQFIEQKNCIGLIGNTVTLSFKARKGGSNATVGTMRAAILAWDGTADTVTSDVVSAWGASGTNPTLVANWTAENTAADLTLTTSFQTFSVSGAVDTASAKNIAVFLYYNNADGTVTDFVYITDVQLEIGSVATPFERRPYSSELALCHRYYGAFTNATFAWSLSATDIAVSQQWPVRMRAAPTLALLDTTIQWNDFNVGDTSVASTIVSSQQVTPEGAVLRIGGFAGHTQNIPGNFVQATDVFSATAEL